MKIIVNAKEFTAVLKTVIKGYVKKGASNFQSSVINFDFSNEKLIMSSVSSSFFFKGTVNIVKAEGIEEGESIAYNLDGTTLSNIVSLFPTSEQENIQFVKETSSSVIRTIFKNNSAKSDLKIPVTSSLVSSQTEAPEHTKIAEIDGQTFSNTITQALKAVTTNGFKERINCLAFIFTQDKFVVYGTNSYTLAYLTIPNTGSDVDGSLYTPYLDAFKDQDSYTVLLQAEEAQALVKSNQLETFEIMYGEKVFGYVDSDLVLSLANKADWEAIPVNSIRENVEYKDYAFQVNTKDLSGAVANLSRLSFLDDVHIEVTFRDDNILVRNVSGDEIVLNYSGTHTPLTEPIMIAFETSVLQTSLGVFKSKEIILRWSGIDETPQPEIIKLNPADEDGINEDFEVYATVVENDD